MKFGILAPHVDDEVIGCYLPLKDGLVDHVIYFYELTATRKQEAINCGKFFGFEPRFNTKPDPSFTYLVPHIKDSHRDHKAVNILAKRLHLSCQYYTVDKDYAKIPIPTSLALEKQKVLNNLFPSQASLFLDEKYSLFETLIPDDMVQYYSNSVYVMNRDETWKVHLKDKTWLPKSVATQAELMEHLFLVEDVAFKIEMPNECLEFNWN